MSSRSYELQMLDLFRIHFFGSRGATRVDHREVSPNQAFVLSELVRRDSPSLDELRRVLKVHLSTLSRAITHLNKVGMVISQKDPHDSRRTRATPTSRGAAFARLSWVSQQAVIAQRLRGFLPVERAALESFLRVFVGENAYQRIVPVADEPEMAIISRALTYDHGVVTDNYLESGYSVIDWITLSEIHYEQRSPGELARLTKTPPSTVSLRLKSLLDRELLAVASGIRDKRAREFRLTKRGIEELKSIEESAQSYFARTLRTLSPTQIEEGISLFGRYVSQLRPEHSLNLHLDRVPKNALEVLRRTLITRLAHIGERYPLGAILLNPTNQIVSLTRNSSSVLILECELETTRSFRLINAIPLSDEVRTPPADSVQEIAAKFLGVQLKIPKSLATYLDSISREAAKA